MARKSKTKRKEKFTIAIVGEGITEWHYFNDLKHHEKYNYEIKPDLPKHSDYSSIIKKAKELIKKGYNLVYCVIDLDYIISDKTIKNKYNEIKNKTENKKIKFIETMPCTEFWFLLHFLKNYSDKEYDNFKSVVTALKKYLPDYEKEEEYFKQKKIYQILIKNGKLENAISYAKQLLINKKESENNLFPFTNIHSLLLNLKDHDQNN